MKRWQLVAAGLAAYALGLIATAPATLLDAGVQRLSSERLRLADAKGTLWSGTATLEFRDASRQSAIAKQVAWRVLPASLLLGRLECEIGIDRAPKRFRLTLTPSRIEIAEADLNLPAAALSLAVPKLAPLKLYGGMLLQVPRLSFGDGVLRGSATLRWSGAGSAITSVAPLGDYVLQLESEGGNQVRATLRTLQGPLQLEGRGAWTLGANPAFEATALVPPVHLQELGRLLRLIAIDRGGGRFDLQLK